MSEVPLYGTTLQGYLAHNPPSPPKNPTIGLYLGSYGGPRGGGLFLMGEVPLYLFASSLYLRFRTVVSSLDFRGLARSLGLILSSLNFRSLARILGLVPCGLERSTHGSSVRLHERGQMRV